MTTHTEASEQYIKNRLGGLVEVDLDGKFDEVNINDDKYKLLKDDDGAGIFDRNGRLFRNNNGEVKLTTGILPPLIRPENTIENSVDLYDFSKPNQENGGSFTEAGRRFYTRQMDENTTEEDKTARLIEIENQLRKAIITDQNRRNKSVEGGSINPSVVDNYEYDEETDTLKITVTADRIGGGGEEDNNKEKEKASSNTGGQEGIQLEFGKVDNIIQKLSLRNLIYPIDADFGNTQDYMQINQFTYRAPNQSVFFGTDKQKDEQKTNPSNIANDGLFMGTPREKHLGLVKLPMPNSLADSNNVSWGADQLNALTAAVASGVFGQTNAAGAALRRIVEADGNTNTIFNIPGTGKITAAGEEVFGLLNNALNQAGDEGKNIFEQLGDSSSNISVLGSAIVGSGLLNFLQFGLSPESVLARGQGVIPNNNLALLFNSPTLREFTFTWKLTPRSREEAIRVNNIIRFFKQGMAPKKGVNTQSGAASYFLGTPNVFDLSFRTTKKGVDNFFFDGDDRNHSVVRIKTCACTGCAVNYTPDGMWNAYERGQPVSVTMSLRFSELEPIFDTDYDENEFNYSPNRPDLLPVPINAVGY